MQCAGLRTVASISTGCIAAALLTGCGPAKAPYSVRATETMPAEIADNLAAAQTVPPSPAVTATGLGPPETGVLEGISEMPGRMSRGDYRRSAFGDSWTDDQDAAGGHNGCDTRNDILNRDLIGKTYKSISSCPNAVATGTLHDPYTGTVIAFTRGAQTGAAVQIDHIVPLAYAWDMGASGWTDNMRVRFANDPANLLAVQGDSNQSKRDKEPAKWMPPNAAFNCQYATRFAEVLRAYGLPIDAPSAAVVASTAVTCPPT